LIVSTLKCNFSAICFEESPLIINVNTSFSRAVNSLIEPVGYFLFSYDYTLDAGSPGIGAGSGGSDIGIYAGNGVYRKDGEPAIPIIRQVNVPGGTTVPANATFTINIISEAHE
jgi:hypothetical protein